MNPIKPILIAIAACSCISAEPLSYSGIYPHLVLSNLEGECGTGAVVPWADRLWVITYAPHKPTGSSDKLCEITPSLEKIIRPESIGGTPANRMIHEESGQLFIGPYAIDEQRKVRTISTDAMFGRLTGLARHLTNPKEKILFATMEEGIYEVDVTSLAVKPLWIDEQLQEGGKMKKGEARVLKGKPANLPGYHGKGFYSAHGRYIYSNNGEHGSDAQKNPRVPSGVLAEWDGKADKWTIVRRNQFTEVTGPGGIRGHADDSSAPLWAVGWDHKSVLLLCLHQNKWHTYRFPKGSHSYDGAHGWNTEWPRIRDVSADGKGPLLMTMHGTFWNFPRNFQPTNSSGITPRSNYLKVVGDFARWQDRIVLGCDDTAKSEFLNKRKAKGHIPAPRSQSNLWFVTDATLDHIGSPIGRGSLWLRENLTANQSSDPYLFSGYQTRGVHLVHGNDSPVTFELEVDVGDGKWRPLEKISVPPHQAIFHTFSSEKQAAWIRAKALADATDVSVVFTYKNAPRIAELTLFEGIATNQSAKVSQGTIRALDNDNLSLAYAATNKKGEPIGYYEMKSDMQLNKVEGPQRFSTLQKETQFPKNAATIDPSSALIIDDEGKRWRFPLSSEIAESFTNHRIAREVATERDLLNLAGIFYELPANNAGGYAMARPISTHNRHIQDFCSWHGLLLLTGIDLTKSNPAHIVRSNDGNAALWAGGIDDLWKFGAPTGIGGPWKNSSVVKNVASDPFLMTGFDKKSLTLESSKTTTIKVEVDLSGYGDWTVIHEFPLVADKPFTHQFDAAFSAYWIRFTSSEDTTASAILTYN